ncbi:MAG: peroxide stress protein YaaA [Magnetococcus sp. YQC-5]
MDADSWDDEDWLFSQTHLRILSGLYGLLRPLDRIQPYRLEMNTQLPNPRGENLYAFWRHLLTSEITSLIAQHHTPIVINLASEEYIKAIDISRLPSPMITPIFKEARHGRLQVIGLLAKRARGAMARYMIQNRLKTPEPLQQFTEGGYRFQAELSNAQQWVFVRGGM